MINSTVIFISSISSGNVSASGVVTCQYHQTYEKSL